MDNEDKPRFTREQVESAEEQIIEQSKRIEFYLTEYTVEILALKMINGEFEIPDYQRDDTWEDKRKSRFIESVLMGLPIPFLFFWESQDTGNLEIVDGSQRLRTIQQFILGDFALGELEELILINGFKFKDLPESRQKKLKNRSIRGIVLNEHADEQARFDIFERINTGSKIANKAEVRRGALGGLFQELVISLAQESVFDRLAPATEKQKKERVREELITRFFAYGDGLESYRDKVSAFLFSYTKTMNAYFKEHPEDINSYRERFLSTMQFIERNFPWGFRRTKNGKVTTNARFEAIAIGSYYALQQKPDLANSSFHVDDWLNSDEFKEIIGADGSNAIGRLKARINFVRDRLLGE
jgi:uncharacterized protein with ParB-like and HNH nuclease domain